MESNLFFPIIVSAHDENLADAPRPRVQSLHLTVPLSAVTPALFILPLPHSIPMVPALDLALCPYLDQGTVAAWISPGFPLAFPHFQQEPLIFCAIKAMPLVTCSAVSAISHETLTVTQILSSLTSLQFYLAIYLLLLILCQKNIDVLLKM